MAATALAEPPPAAKLSPQLTAAQEWMTFYYAHPQPDRFVEHVRALAAGGVLGDLSRQLATTTFLSRVMAANPKKIRPWMSALAELKGNELLAVRTAAWFSNTVEAKSYLAEVDTKKEFVEAPPEMLETATRALHALDLEVSPTMLDVFWSYYHATGDPRAIRGVISALEYIADFGAAQRFRASKQTEEDKKAALRDALFQAASWSLESHLRQHPPLKKLCAELAAGSSLKPNEKTALANILKKIDQK